MDLISQDKIKLPIYQAKYCVSINQNLNTDLSAKYCMLINKNLKLFCFQNLHQLAYSSTNSIMVPILACAYALLAIGGVIYAKLLL